MLSLLAAGVILAGCSNVETALTSHSRPAARAVGNSLSTDALGRIIAESPVPDSALEADAAIQVARLWADYVILARIYERPDTTLSVDFSTLLEEGQYLATLTVQKLQDSVLSLSSRPSEEEVREYFETRQPFTRLDLRRIVIPVPAGADEAIRDSLYEEAIALRERLAGGADFVEVSREWSSEPPRVLQFQGHESIPPIADSALFAMRPGEISPVFSTGDAMLIYRLEQRRAPDFETAREQTMQRMVDERGAQNQSRTLDSLLAASQPSVPDDAPESAIRIARRADMARGSISPSAGLARYEGGSVTADEYRRLLSFRPDLRNRFASASEDEAYGMLLELAVDEVLLRAAEDWGLGPSQEEREELELAFAERLASIATRYRLEHKRVVDPAFDLDSASKDFLRIILQAQEPVPWLSEFRHVLDAEYPSSVDESGSETAARLARDLRQIDSRSPVAASEPAGDLGATEGRIDPPEQPGADDELSGQEREDPAEEH